MTDPRNETDNLNTGMSPKEEYNTVKYNVNDEDKKTLEKIRLEYSSISEFSKEYENLRMKINYEQFLKYAEEDKDNELRSKERTEAKEKNKSYLKNLVRTKWRNNQWAEFNYDRVMNKLSEDEKKEIKKLYPNNSQYVSQFTTWIKILANKLLKDSGIGDDKLLSVNDTIDDNFQAFTWSLCCSKDYRWLEWYNGTTWNDHTEWYFYQIAMEALLKKIDWLDTNKINLHENIDYSKVKYYITQDKFWPKLKKLWFELDEWYKTEAYAQTLYIEWDKIYTNSWNNVWKVDRYENWLISGVILTLWWNDIPLDFKTESISADTKESVITDININDQVYDYMEKEMIKLEKEKINNYINNAEYLNWANKDDFVFDLNSIVIWSETWTYEMKYTYKWAEYNLIFNKTLEDWLKIDWKTTKDENMSIYIDNSNKLNFYNYNN